MLSFQKKGFLFIKIENKTLLELFKKLRDLITSSGDKVGHEIPSSDVGALIRCNHSSAQEVCTLKKATMHHKNRECFCQCF